MKKLFIMMFSIIVFSIIVNSIIKDESPAEKLRNQYRNEKDESRLMCKFAIRKTLKHPSTVQWGHNKPVYIEETKEGRIYNWASYFKSKNSFGMLMKNTFSCKTRTANNDKVFIIGFYLNGKKVL